MTQATMTPAEVASQMSNFALVLNNLAQHASDLAHARRTMFDAYIAEGFTEAQALELCKSLLS